MKKGNRFYDRLVAAMREPDRARREREFEKIETDVKELKIDAARRAGLLARVMAGQDPGKEVGEAIGDVLIGLLLPAVQKVQQAHDRSVQIERNLHVAFALAAYRADNGRYPARLDDLAPKYLAEVPNDLFTGRPLIYKPSEKGYRLYSVGVNGKDDGGRWTDDTPPGDDPGVKMPLPPLKK
jgi:hypothetical protein